MADTKNWNYQPNDTHIGKECEIKHGESSEWVSDYSCTYLGQDKHTKKYFIKDRNGTIFPISYVRILHPKFNINMFKFELKELLERYNATINYSYETDGLAGIVEECIEVESDISNEHFVLSKRSYIDKYELSKNNSGCDLCGGTNSLYINKHVNLICACQMEEKTNE